MYENGPTYRYVCMYLVQTDTAQQLFRAYVQYSMDNGRSSLHGELAAVTQWQYYCSLKLSLLSKLLVHLSHSSLPTYVATSE